MNFNDTLKLVSTVLQGVVGLGMSLAVTFLVVDVLFPGTTHIVDNVAALVKNFTGQGLVGLITLIVFIVLFRRE